MNERIASMSQLSQWTAAMRSPDVNPSSDVKSTRSTSQVPTSKGVPPQTGKVDLKKAPTLNEEYEEEFESYEEDFEEEPAPQPPKIAASKLPVPIAVNRLAVALNSTDMTSDSKT